ncbi:MAG TPA: phosphotransferase family protein [Acidimicrobiales bacterium]|nr:phosphotransferase family protein [Acidimicrobiales bacterium]
MEEALAEVLGASSVTELKRLSGGASRDTFAFDADGRPLILQRQRVAGARDFATESALLREARRVGVPVAEVLATDDDATDDQRAAIGAAFMVVERLEGQTIARKILRDEEFAGARTKLATQCGEALAGIHSIPNDAVPGLEQTDQVAQYRTAHDQLGVPSPAFELGFRWLESNRPASSPVTVVHGDFRLGNLIIDADGLRAVIDWELGHLGDPMEDLGWLCTKAWRFGAKPRVGGFGEIDDLVAAYEARSGAAVDRDALRWWEVLGTLKWGVMCNMQASAHLSGMVRSVELATIGRRVCEQEHDLLLLLP